MPLCGKKKPKHPMRRRRLRRKNADCWSQARRRRPLRKQPDVARQADFTQHRQVRERVHQQKRGALQRMHDGASLRRCTLGQALDIVQRDHNRSTGHASVSKQFDENSPRISALDDAVQPARRALRRTPRPPVARHRGRRLPSLARHSLLRLQVSSNDCPRRWSVHALSPSAALRRDTVNSPRRRKAHSMWRSRQAAEVSERRRDAAPPRSDACGRQRLTPRCRAAAGARQDRHRRSTDEILPPRGRRRRVRLCPHPPMSGHARRPSQDGRIGTRRQPTSQAPVQSPLLRTRARFRKPNQRRDSVRRCPQHPGHGSRKSRTSAPPRLLSMVCRRDRQ